jgi:hypothetical protein
VLIRLPEEWPQPLVAALAMVVLAVLDLAGAVAAKEAVLHRSAGWALLGSLAFVVLFWVYSSSLQYAELAPVTFGWVVVLQIGLVLLDRLRYDIGIPAGKWVAIVVLVAAQAYLILGPAGPAAGAHPAPRSSAPGAAPAAVSGDPLASGWSGARPGGPAAAGPGELRRPARTG